VYLGHEGHKSGRAGLAGDVFTDGNHVPVDALLQQSSEQCGAARHSLEIKLIDSCIGGL